MINNPTKRKRFNIQSQKLKTKNPVYSCFFLLTFCLVLLGMPACNRTRNTPATQQTASPPSEDLEGTLILSNTILEQVDEQGQLLWKVKAKQGKYTKDKKIADVQNPNGELFQDGKLVFQVQAKQGIVQQDGEKIFLKQDIVATDIKSGAVLRGDELEWLPKQDLLIIRNNLTGTHQQLDAAAKEGRMFTRKRELELIGQVVATTKEPVLQLQTEHLFWKIDQELVIGDQPIQIQRYQAEKVTDTATAKQGQVNLDTKIATLTQNATVNLMQPPMQIESEEMNWNVEQETVTSQVPVKVTHLQEQLVFSSNEGWIDINQQMCYLTGNVQGFEGRRQSQIRADQLTWNLNTQAMEAQGNVIYSQQNPPFTVNGTQAYGKLNDQTVTVINQGGPVVTEILPE